MAGVGCVEGSLTGVCVRHGREYYSCPGDKVIAQKGPVARLHGSGTKAHWDVDFLCCHLPGAVNLSVERASEIIDAHQCAPSVAEPTADALGECRRWLYRAVYDVHVDRRRQAAVLLMETLRVRCVNEVGIASLAAWLGGGRSPEEPS